MYLLCHREYTSSLFYAKSLKNVTINLLWIKIPNTGTTWYIQAATNSHTFRSICMASAFSAIFAAFLAFFANFDRSWSSILSKSGSNKRISTACIPGKMPVPEYFHRHSARVRKYVITRYTYHSRVTRRLLKHLPPRLNVFFPTLARNWRW